MSQIEWDSEEEIEDKPFNRLFMKRMLSYLNPYKKTLAIVGFIVLIGMLLSLAEPLIIKYVIDEGIIKQQSNVIHLAGIALVAIQLINWVLGVIRIRMINFTGQRILYQLRQQIFNHLQTLSFRFFDGRPTGKIMSRITNDTNAIGELINGGLITTLMECTHLIGIIVILLYLDWQLALMAFIVLPFLYVLVTRFRPSIEGAWSRSRRSMSAINGNISETIQGMRVIQAFSRQENNLIRFKAINANNRNAYMRAVKLESLVWPMVEMIGMAGTCIVLWYGATKVINGALEIGVIVAFINYLWRFWGPLSALSKVYSQLLSAMASAERIFEILDTDPEVKDTAEAQPMPTIRGHVRFEQVSFRYGPDQPNVLKDINLTIQPGQRVALVGPTGAGKSTIVNLLMRFYNPTSGRILIDGLDIHEVKLDSLREQMGIVLQDSFIFSGTIEENLRYGNEQATQEQLEQAVQNVRLNHLIEQLPDGYHTYVAERGTKLSVGQRQLLAFGRVLLADPRILILDEATSSVDTETEQHIQEALNVLLKGRTSFIIAHRLSTIRHADIILVIDHGQIKEQGTHEELIAMNGIYAKLYSNQFMIQQGLQLRAAT